MGPLTRGTTMEVNIDTRLAEAIMMGITPARVRASVQHLRANRSWRLRHRQCLQHLNSGELRVHCCMTAAPLPSSLLFSKASQGPAAVILGPCALVLPTL